MDLEYWCYELSHVTEWTPMEISKMQFREINMLFKKHFGGEMEIYRYNPNDWKD